MNLDDCTKFAAEYPVCSIATMEGNQARVRVFMMWRANESGFYFETLSPKNVYKQMNANPKVEICFSNNEADLQNVKTMRVTGEVEFLADADLKKQLLEDWPFIKDAEPVLELFRIKSGEAWFWTMNDILKENEIERIKF